jgi:oxygen-independent coproporphyrinogen-3 oxidase
MTLPVTSELLRKYDRPGPRYTSYPTAVEFNESFTPAKYREHLARANAVAQEPLSLYIHIPFCEERCTFCGCHVIITRHHDRAVSYLDYLARELDLLAQALPDRRHLIQYHWGGGTPTYLTPAEIRQLWSKVKEHFTIAEDAEVAIEVDPRATSREHVDTLGELGFNRLSMGVQDFTPEVQSAINRNQTEAETRDLFAYCRRIGFTSINLDLIYGLPLQTPATFRRNLDAVIALRPDRVACYSYAHVPWIRGHQKGIDITQLPSPEVKLELLAAAIGAFQAAGYRQIGMDHFALPDDELAQAMARGTLWRNFMGYTTKVATDMVGVGVSAIGDVRGAFAQNEKKLSTYYQALERGEFPVQRGFELSFDDHVRRLVITELMCNFRLRKAEITRRFGIDFDAYFGLELEELAQGPAAEGFVRLTPERIEVTPLGQLFVRNVCMIFDAYLRRPKDEKPVFSRTV